MPGTGTSVEFDGVDDKVDIPDGPGFTALRKELSALCWMRADQLSGAQRFFGNGAGGQFSSPVDLFDLPLWPHVSAQVGETWHFQAWYTVLNSSNFTDGLSVTF